MKTALVGNTYARPGIQVPPSSVAWGQHRPVFSQVPLSLGTTEIARVQFSSRGCVGEGVSGGVPVWGCVGDSTLLLLPLPEAQSKHPGCIHQQGMANIHFPEESAIQGCLFCAWTNPQAEGFMGLLISYTILQIRGHRAGMGLSPHSNETLQKLWAAMAMGSDSTFCCATKPIRPNVQEQHLLPLWPSIKKRLSITRWFWWKKKKSIEIFALQSQPPSDKIKA